MQPNLPAQASIVAGTTSYTGMIQNGLPNGLGKLVTPQFTYVGNFIAGLRQGYGQIDYSNGKSYEGDFKQDTEHGVGFLKDSGFQYEGEFVNGKKHGRGHQSNLPNTPRWDYQGDFHDDQPNGTGKLETDSFIYEGEFVGGQCEGFGILQRKEMEEAYEGMFVKGKYQGNGVLRRDGVVTVGIFDQGELKPE